MTFTHGASAYNNHGCRCDVCRAGNRTYRHWHRRAAHAAMLAGDLSPKHGSLSTYLNYMCRCDECRTARREARRPR